MIIGPELLYRALDSVPDVAWSKPSEFWVTNVHHGYRRVGLINYGSYSAVWGFGEILQLFAPVKGAFLSMLEPGGFIVPHIDGSPHYERWQVPIRAAGIFGESERQDGVAFQVEHWKPHAVWNNTDRRRIHLVVDRDVIIDNGKVSFQRLPIPDEFKGLIQSASIAS